MYANYTTIGSQHFRNVDPARYLRNKNVMLASDMTTAPLLFIIVNNYQQHQINRYLREKQFYC
jgi:hypothetical protein